MHTQPEVREVAAGFSFLESPRWHEGRLWLSDFYTHRVVTIDPVTESVETICEVEHQPSGLGWLPDGTLLVVSMTDRRILHLDGETLSEHADLSGVVVHPLNDMVVDHQGRAYVGNFGFDLMRGAEPAPTDLIRVDPNGTVTAVASDMLFPNGTVITPDGRTLIAAETVGRRLSAFDVATDGTLSGRRTWAQFDRLRPDGIALDAEGCIWAADARGGQVVRVAPGGDMLTEINPGIGTFACMLGGEERTTLFICAAPSFDAKERADTRDSVLLAVEVEVPGAGLP